MLILTKPVELENIDGEQIERGSRGGQRACGLGAGSYTELGYWCWYR
jgi:hypothetical protein